MSCSRRLWAALVLMMLCTTILASSLFGQEQRKEPLPKFFVRKTTVDLGVFYEGEDIEHQFTVRNNGVGELQIVSVRPG